jgi:uncharacterized membrane protein SirB2
MARSDMSIARNLHVLFAYLTVVSFTVRAVLSLFDSGVLRKRWVRVVPHINDTLLLLFGVALAVQYRMSPLAHHWLAVKIIMLLVYIGLGTVAMRARSLPLKLAGLVGALASVLYIIAVAHTRQPFPL